MASPFDMQGPEFLVFYIVLGIGVNMLLRSLILQKEKDRPAALLVCNDPYKLAYLRAGACETLRVVLFSLIDRGLLKASGAAVAAEPYAREMVRRPVEQTVVAFFTKPHQAREIFDYQAAIRACDVYCRELFDEGMLADKAVFASRRNLSLAALFLLGGISATKIAVALSRGRQNIVLLILLTIIFTLWAISTWNRKRTGAGEEVLLRARLNFKPLKDECAARLRPGGMTNDAVFLAAAFGMAALPSGHFPYVATLFPQAVKSSGDSSYSGGCGGGGGCGGCGGGGGCGGCGG
jgi:uncharacterized protein (TIGR04222 family)